MIGPFRSRHPVEKTPPTREPDRIPNPFSRFDTRGRWLATIIRRGRDAGSEKRQAPGWFNR